MFSTDLSVLAQAVLSLGGGLQLGALWLQLLDALSDALQLLLDLLVLPLPLSDLVLCTQ